MKINRVTETERAIAGYKILVASLTAQLEHYRKQGTGDEAARRTLDSEREANRILTEENERLRRIIAGAK